MRLFTTAEAQQAYGIPAITLARLCRAGKFADARQIGGKWHIPASSIEAIVAPNSINQITSGNMNGNMGLAIGQGAYSHIEFNYREIRPQTVSPAILAGAEAQLAQLPLDHIPAIAALPPGSRLVYNPNPLFVGREVDLRTLAAALKHDGATAAIGQITAATGLGGIGKTQLADAFVRRYGQFFSGGVHWLSFADPANIINEMIDCGAYLPDKPVNYAILSRDDKLYCVLAAWQSALPRLLVFDDCEDPDLLKRFRPHTGGARVLITSRRATWPRGSGVKALKLGVLAQQESISLLRKFISGEDAMFTSIPSPITDEMLGAIADELGNLPLALHLAGSFLWNYQYTVKPAEYLEALQRPTLLQHLSLIQGDDSPTDHELHVGRTFALSYNKLVPSNEVDSLAQTFLAHIACFAPGEFIPRSLLIDSVQLAENPRPYLAEDALRRLIELGLVDAGTDGSLLVHRLLARFIEDSARNTISVARGHVEAAVLRHASTINQTQTPAPLLPWQTHLRHLTEIAKRRCDARAAALCFELGAHLHMASDYATAQRYLEAATTLSQTVFGEYHPISATSLSSLGILLHDIGHLEVAQQHLARALLIREALFEEKHRDTANSLHALGTLLLERGEQEAAQSYYMRALAIRQALLGDEHPDTAASFNGWGYFLYTRREWATAERFFTRALEIRRRLLGNQHPDTATTLENIGLLIQARGDTLEAQPYLEEALSINRQVLGENHPATALSLNSLGGCLQELGDLAVAQAHFEHALAILETKFDAGHPRVKVVRNNLIALQSQQPQSLILNPQLER